MEEGGDDGGESSSSIAAGKYNTEVTIIKKTEC